MAPEEPVPNISSHSQSLPRLKRQQTKRRFASLRSIKHQTSNIKQQTTNIKHQTSNIKHQTSNIKHQTSNIKQTTNQKEALLRKKKKEKTEEIGEREHH